MKKICELLKNDCGLSIVFNGDSCEKYGIFLYDIPSISTANEDYKSNVVAGRSGYMITPTGAIDNIKINCTFSILNEHMIPNVRKIKQWLKGTGILQLSETPDSFYEVLWVTRGNLERELKKYGTITVEFICYPYEFAYDSDHKYKPSDGILYNPYSEAMAEYAIKGEGMCTLTVNGFQMKANIGQNLIINTRKQIAYRKDGRLENTAVTGRYDKLYLKAGANEISITDGFELEVIPHWGWSA